MAEIRVFKAQTFEEITKEPDFGIDVSTPDAQDKAIEDFRELFGGELPDGFEAFVRGEDVA